MQDGTINFYAMSAVKIGCSDAGSRSSEDSLKMTGFICESCE